MHVLPCVSANLISLCCFVVYAHVLMPHTLNKPPPVLMAKLLCSNAGVSVVDMMQLSVMRIEFGSVGSAVLASTGHGSREQPTPCMWDCPPI